MSDTVNYTSNANIKDYWLNKIGPNYFNLDNTNNYNVGLFGYVNEVMANSVEDGFNAITTARREFYPITAINTTSLYDMAALQGIDIPLTTPSICKCALILDQDEVLNNSIILNETSRIKECVVDSTLKLYADNLVFMIDHPIIIQSKETDKIIHTVYYDTAVDNTLSTGGGKYISNQVLSENGKNYLILFLDVIRQVEMYETSNIVSNGNILDTFNIDIDFDGNIANFEVFYKETPTSPEVQLAKILANDKTPKSPFVQYKFIDDNRIRLIFEYNSTFNPLYNSEIICRIYTSQGEDGNFVVYNNDLPCSCESDRYPYNANMTFVGKINGSATGGKNRPSMEDFREDILNAYSTNNTITTSQDLQKYFDYQTSSLIDSKVLFKKKRDDALIRLFGAYLTLKDVAGNILPTNTLEVELNKNDFNTDSTTTRFSIPPGTIFAYKDENSYTVVPLKNSSGKILNLLDVSATDYDISDKLYFTNPFLLGVTVYPNNIGYYFNSVNTHMPIEYSYVNDESAQQFIGGSTSVYRNGIIGSNYYKIQIRVAPASELDYSTVVTINDPADPNNQIIAPYNGRVVSEKYVYNETTNVGFIEFTIEYDTDDESEKFVTIQGSNTLPIGKASVTGYKLNYNTSEHFIKGDIIATKRVDDKGQLVLCGDIARNLYVNDYYIPFSIQDYDATLNAYILDAYISTNDEIDVDENITLEYGIYNKDGTMNHSMAIHMRDQFIDINVLYNNPGDNIKNKYSDYAGLNEFTLTNRYNTSETNKFDFITSLPYIRSSLKYLEDTKDSTNFIIRIDETPMVGALWSTVSTNYNYFIDQYNQLNDKFRVAFYSLENNFSIDSKFYNTYGKARFFKIGNSEETLLPLDSIKCSFKFGVKLNNISSTDTFLQNFRKFIKDYVEDTATLTSSGRDIFIMNMISAIKANFTEIIYLEYYGMNNYDYSIQKVVGPELDEYWEEFVPEFVNLDTIIDQNGLVHPAVYVTIL